jgi:hypothetical protein
MDLTLEQALSDLESQLATASKAAKSALAELKKVQSSAKFGQLRDFAFDNPVWPTLTFTFGPPSLV